MKNKTYKYLNFSLLVLVVAFLFLVNPFFENKYLNAERNVQVFKKYHRPEYDSLVREYKVQSELIHFKKDSAENVLNSKFNILKHEIEMQKLTGMITEDYYHVRFEEIMKLEIAESSAVTDSFVQRLIRLDYPEEMKVPRNLSKEVTLYEGITGFIWLIKWFLLVLAIILFIVHFLKYKNIKEKKSQTIFSEMPKFTGEEDDKGNFIICEPATLKQANALKLEMKKEFGDIFNLHTELIANSDKTEPQMFQLTIMPKQQLNLSQRLHKFFMKEKFWTHKASH